MSRVLELISFLRRGREASAHQSSAPSFHPSEMTDADFSRDAMELQSFLGSASPIPQDLREAIAWAEEQKAKVKMN